DDLQAPPAAPRRPDRGAGIRGSARRPQDAAAARRPRMRRMPARRYHIETWGCQMNRHDSEKMAGLLGALGYTPARDAREADLVLLNTCSVRDKAESKVYSRLGALGRLKRANPDLFIGVVGCVAQQVGEGIFRRAPFVDLVMGPRNISR